MYKGGADEEEDSEDELGAKVANRRRRAKEKITTDNGRGRRDIATIQVAENDPIRDTTTTRGTM